MSTLTIITAAILAVLVLNSAVVIYLRRKGRIPNKAVLRRSLPAANMVVLFLMVGFMVAGLGAPKVAPDSRIAHLIADVGNFVYFAWCMIIAVAIQIVLGLLVRVRSKT